MARLVDISGNLPETVRHWYICGPDAGLVMAATQEVRSWMGERSSRVDYLDAERSTRQEVAEFLSGGGAVPGQLPALLILQNADALDLSFLNQEKAQVWSQHLLAVGRERTAASADAQFTYFFKRQSGKAVVCNTPSRERLSIWVQKRLRCEPDVASEMVYCSGGDTMWLAQEVQKLAALGVGPNLTVPHIYRVTAPTAQGDLVGALLREDKHLALQCIPSKQSAAAVLRALEDVVVKGALVYHAQGNVGSKSRMLAKRTSLQMKEVGMLREHVNTFARHPTERRLRALARVSPRALRGERQAWLSLIALW